MKLPDDTLLSSLEWDHHLRTRILSRLNAIRIVTIGDLSRAKESDLLRITNFGRRCLRAVNDVLASAGAEPLDSWRKHRARERRLILAAPELLAALKDICEYIGNNGKIEYGRHGNDFFSDGTALLESADALIARIEGK